MKAWYEAVDVSLLSLSWWIALCACRGTPGGILELSWPLQHLRCQLAVPVGLLWAVFSQSLYRDCSELLQVLERWSHVDVCLWLVSSTSLFSPPCLLTNFPSLLHVLACYFQVFNAKKLHVLVCYFQVFNAKKLSCRYVPHSYCILSLNEVKVCRTQIKEAPDPCWDEEFMLEWVTNALHLTILAYCLYIIIIIIQDLYSAMKSEDTEALEMNHCTGSNSVWYSKIYDAFIFLSISWVQLEGRGCGSVSILGRICQYLCCVSKKDPRHYRLQLEGGLTDFNNFWYDYSWHNWPSRDHLHSHLPQRLLLHYVG